MSDLNYHRILSTTLIGAALLVGTVGCEQLPGTPKTQGAVIGGVGGAAAGAAIGGENNRVLGALVGGALGAGGGYLIGANSDRILHRDQAGADQAVQSAQSRPATPQDALRAQTADLNGDGFVTLDEVVAMRAAGFSDQQMLERLRATGQIFELTAEQQRYLQDNGLSPYLVNQIMYVNRDVRDRLLGQQNGVISRPPGPQY
jgi:Glycine zipper 2TM domain